MAVNGFRIISGGQTGVDRAAFDAALEHGISIGGCCPKGRRAEDGDIPEVYPLIELSSKNYKVRTQKNVVESDGTLILNKRRLSTGTLLTRDLAVNHGKPCLVVQLDALDSQSQARVVTWIQRNHILVLNVAGPRESKSPGIYEAAKAFLTEVFQTLSH